MDTHLIKSNLCVCSIFCQRCDVTVNRTNCLPYLKEGKNTISGESKMIKRKRYLLEYSSNNESLSSTIGIELTRAVRVINKMASAPIKMKSSKFIQ